MHQRMPTKLELARASVTSALVDWSNCNAGDQLLLSQTRAPRPSCSIYPVFAVAPFSLPFKLLYNALQSSQPRIFGENLPNLSGIEVNGDTKEDFDDRSTRTELTIMGIKKEILIGVIINCWEYRYCGGGKREIKFCVQNSRLIFLLFFFFFIFFQIHG